MSIEPRFAHSALHARPGAGWLGAAPSLREGLLLGLAMTLLACLPVLVASYPQMSDYPSHLARFHVMLDGGQSADLNRYYGFEWKWTGNLGADLLIRPLAALFGLEAAGRLIVGLLPVLMGLSIMSVDWALRRRIGVASMLGFAFIWSPSLLLGFLNFILSMALALFAFAGWVALKDWRWRPAVFLPVGLLVWLCHVSGWGVLGLMVFGYEWHRSKSWRAFIAPWPLLLPLWPLLLGGGTKGDLSYGPNPLFFKQVLWKRAMRDQVEWLDKASLALVGLTIFAAIVRRRFDGRLGWAALIMLLGSLAMPRHIVGGDYADYRLISTGLLAAVLAISWQVPRWVLWLAPALFLVRLGVTTESWHSRSAETEVLLTALDHVPQGARVASAVGVPFGNWGFNTFEHVGSYATVRRDALVNSHFALPRVHMINLKDGGSYFRDPSQRRFYASGKPIDLAGFAPAYEADYLWYVGSQRPAILPKGARVIYATPNSLLAKLANPPHDS